MPRISTHTQKEAMVAQLALEKQHLMAFPAEVRARSGETALAPAAAPQSAAPPPAAALRRAHARARAGGF